MGEVWGNGREKAFAHLMIFEEEGASLVRCGCLIEEPHHGRRKHLIVNL